MAHEKTYSELYPLITKGDFENSALSDFIGGFDDTVYPDTFYNSLKQVLTPESMQKLLAEGYIKDDHLAINTAVDQNLNPLAAILGMIVWKNGDADKLKWMIRGGTDGLSLEEKYADKKSPNGVVFYQFGRHIVYDSVESPEPIIDRRALTAFFHFVAKGNIQDADLRDKSTRESGQYVAGPNFSALNMAGYFQYVAWFKKTFSGKDEDFRRNVDKVMFGIGKAIDAQNKS